MKKEVIIFWGEHKKKYPIFAVFSSWKRCNAFSKKIEGVLTGWTAILRKIDVEDHYFFREAENN